LNLSVVSVDTSVFARQKFCLSKNINGSVGIAHTRWATHGEPNDVNSYPHVSNDRSIAVVHNSISSSVSP
jgi:glucosamine--fructose-6-phosphate aminotransferase (isomerizing)